MNDGQRLEPGAGSTAGFTLLEMIAVLTIVAVLLGLGIGFLQRGSTDLDLARAILRDQIRLAQTTARARTLPTEVRILPAANDDLRGHVQARVLTPVGHWHCEPDERWLAAALQPAISGRYEPAGRFGQALRPDPDRRQALLSVATGGKPLFDLAEGFALRLEVLPEQRHSATVARLGRAFVLALDNELVPELRCTLAGSGGRPGTTVAVKARIPLQLAQWTTLEAVHDGRTLALYIEGREAGSAAAAGRPYQANSDLFEVSTGDAAFAGVVDEIQLLAYELGPMQDLPPETTVDGPPRTVAFGRRGDLVAPVTFTLVVREERVRLTVGPGGILQ